MNNTKTYKCPNCGGELISTSIPDLFNTIFPGISKNNNRYQCLKCKKIFEKVNKPDKK